jgi:hypothetical protein
MMEDSVEMSDVFNSFPRKSFMIHTDLNRILFYLNDKNRWLTIKPPVRKCLDVASA